VVLFKDLWTAKKDPFYLEKVEEDLPTWNSQNRICLYTVE
jgi:hypothetical protein